MRYRNRGIGIYSDSSTRAGTCRNPPGAPPYCPVSRITEFWDDETTYSAMVDTSDPEFTKKRNKGELVFNPMWQETILTKRSPILGDVYYTQTDSPAYTGVASSRYDPAPVSTTPLLLDTDTSDFDAFLSEFQSERDVATTSAWANVDQSKIGALESLGELPETIRWMVDVYTRLIRVLALYKARKLRIYLSRSFRNKLALAGAMSDFWLEMRYAVRPLAFEMEQIVDVITGAELSDRQTARGYHHVTSTWSTVNEDIQWRGNSYYTCDELIVSSRSSKYRAGVLYSIGTDAYQWAYVLGLDKPLEAVWELTKLSFVLDWLLNVGDLLASLTISSNLTPLGSWITEEHTIKHMWSYQNFQENLPSNYTDISYEFPVDGTGSVTRWMKRRIISPVKPSFPHVRVNLDLAKIVDLVAIARSIYRGF